MPNNASTSNFLGSSYSNLVSSTTSSLVEAETPVRGNVASVPSPSPSLPTIDTNNNKNLVQNSREHNLTAVRRSNFSKSASGSRLTARGRQSVCDCLSKDCAEKTHSNRRQFIEHYYNSRTQLPSTSKTVSTSSINVGTPLNKLSECDAITKRLLSSPQRGISVASTITSSTSQSTKLPTSTSEVADTLPALGCTTRKIVNQKSQSASEVDKSRRASLGTNSMTDQVLLFASNPFKALESFRKSKQDSIVSDNQQRGCDSDKAEMDLKLKQQSRSLSVCDEETLNPKLRTTATSNHSSNLNRAISLACEASDQSPVTKRLLNIIPLFGCDIKSLEQFARLGLILPPVIDSAIDHILENGINSVGIFRKSGVKSRILTLRQKIEANQEIKMDEINRNNEFSIYDIADLVKMWFRELKPFPLVTKELISLISSSLVATPAVSPLGSTTTTVSSSTSPSANISSYATRDIPNLRRVAGTTSQQEKVLISSTQGEVSIASPSFINKINSMTSPTHRALLLRAMRFLARISSKCEQNQMTSQNLAICLTPSLCATESDQSSIILAQRALEYCIDNCDLLFEQRLESTL